MRSVLRRYGAGTVLCVVGAALLLAGAAGALGYVALHEDSPAPSPDAPAQTAPGGLAIGARLDLDLPLLDVGPLEVDPQPTAAGKVALPGASVRRDVSARPVSGVGLDAALDVASGSHRAKAGAAPAEVATSSAQLSLGPSSLAPVAAAAAALTLAGALAYFWSGVKAVGVRVAVLPGIALYAKISRAQVFDNGVRERIFQAIRHSPGLSASDLSRAADVSWGTTIYHLEVLEQTRMVSSIRKGRYRRYFENGAVLATSKDAVAVLRNPVTANVVEVLRARPGVTQKELAGATGMTPQALHWHLARLLETGLIRKERAGRSVRHFAGA